MIGPDGSGRTTVLERWASASGAIVIRCHPDGTHEPTFEPDAPGPVAIDDAHHADDTFLGSLRTSGRPLLLATTPSPWSPALADLVDRVDPRDEVVLSAWDEDEIARAIGTTTGRAVSSQALEELSRWTAGSAVLVMAVAEVGDIELIDIDGDEPVLPPSLHRRLQRRLRRLPAGVLDIVDTLVVSDRTDLDTAILATAHHGDHDRAELERALRTSGAVHDGSIAELIVAARTIDLTVAERERLRTRLEPSLAVVAPDRLEPGTITGVDTAIAVLLSGRHDDEAARLLDLVDPRSAGLDHVDAKTIDALADLAFTLGHPAAMGLAALGERPARRIRDWELRHLRFGAAADLDGDQDAPADDLAVFAAQLVGRTDIATTVIDSSSLAGQVIRAVDRVTGADTTLGLEELASIRDRPWRSDDLLPAPDIVAGLLHLLAGRARTAVDLFDAGTGTGDGLARFARLLLGEMGPASNWERTATGGGPSERYIRTAITAGLARRVGDTTRMRAAWAEAEVVLARSVVSWATMPLLAELVLAGLRLDHRRLTDDVLTRLRTQVSGHDPGSASVAALGWLDTRVAIARRDPAALQIALRTLPEVDEVGLRRRRLAEAWHTLLTGGPELATIRDAATELARVDDPWEAAQLLGAAALDVDDPDAARTLLTDARAMSSTAPEEPSADGLLAKGLSDREVEVARMVAEGRTHKDVGAALYISPKTVEHHVARIRQKLGAANRREFLEVVRSTPTGASGDEPPTIP